MAKLLLMVLLVYGAVVYFDRHPGPAKAAGSGATGAGALVIEENAPYVAVFGRESCGYTQEMLRNLEQAGIEHRFISVDDPALSGPMHERMLQKGLDTSYYLLPVVEVGGNMSIRPEYSQVSARYRELHGG